MASPAAPAAAPPAAEALPEGWTSAADPTSRKTYYINTATKETRWEKPTAAAETTPA